MIQKTATVKMIELVTDRDDNGALVVSHGIDPVTGKVVILPNEHPKNIDGAFWHKERGWLLPMRTCPDTTPTKRARRETL